MYLIAIGWIYVVFMMAITETSVVAGVATFFFYGLIPVAIILYLGSSRQRRRKKQMEEEMRRNAIISSQEMPADVPAPEEKEPRSS